jgi:tRNA A37 threonylcarbamoyladenosine synthetase subunit TsaC/SUA5/YrdC
MTLIFKKSEIIPMKITADTGYVGVRIPNNKTALELIKTSGCPIAAPSANLFNHISPVNARHVFNDFPKEDLLILD